MCIAHLRSRSCFPKALTRSRRDFDFERDGNMCQDAPSHREKYITTRARSNRSARAEERQQKLTITSIFVHHLFRCVLASLQEGEVVSRSITYELKSWEIDQN